MTPSKNAITLENKDLKKRLHKLAAEKDYNQLAIQMMVNINQASGLGNIIDNVLQSIIGASGGSNVSITYLQTGK